MMIGNIINLIYRGLTIKRWNNYPKIDNYSESEHIGLKLNIALILTHILKEKGKEIDLLYIYKNIFWSSFFTFIYSDLKFDVKKHVKNSNPEIYKQFRKKLGSFLVSLNLPNIIKNDLLDIFQEYEEGNLFESRYRLENEIILFVRALEGKIEIENNAKIYSLAYGDVLVKIENEIKERADSLGFQEFEILQKYLSNFVKLKFAQRRNRHNRKYPVSVLSHLYFVFSFSYFLALLKNFNKDDAEEILNISLLHDLPESLTGVDSSMFVATSLLHDLPESLTGDVISPTKSAVEGFSLVLNDIEKELVRKDIISNLKDYKFSKKLEKIMLDPFSGRVGKIAKYSDLLSAMFESKIEENTATYKNIKNTLWMKDDEALNYILKFGVDCFEENVESKRGEFLENEKNYEKNN